MIRVTAARRINVAEKKNLKGESGMSMLNGMYCKKKRAPEGVLEPTRERNYDKNGRSRAFAHVVITTAMAQSFSRPWHQPPDAAKHAKAGLR